MAPKRTAKKAAAAAAVPEPVPPAPTPGAEPESEPVLVHEAGQELDDVSEHVVLQIPITEERFNDLLHKDTDMQTVFEYNPVITEPSPYVPQNTFVSNPVSVSIENPETKAPLSVPAAAGIEETAALRGGSEGAASTHKHKTCFWCCHHVGPMCHGMPVRYDTVSKSFATYGNFCSLECAAAFNFSSHMGSDRAWEIHTWIQMLGRRFGYADPIRPAPSRYLLQMFEGPLTIEEFRAVHKTQSRTLVLNIPPMVSLNATAEGINTSFWSPTNSHGEIGLGGVKTEAVANKPKPTRISKKTLDAKMNLTIVEAPAA